MRDIRIDNIKGILIFLTVLGHLTELISGGTSTFIYRLIYSFHMPAFIFISGYFAKWQPKKLLTFSLPLYLIAQTAFRLFESISEGHLDIDPVKFLTPYWHLWYLFALILYQLTLPLLQALKGRWQHLFFTLSIFLSLIFPCVKSNLYLLSTGRFFAFLPFFTAGYFCGHGKGFPKLKFLLPFSLLFVLCCKRLTLKMLYGSFPYSSPYDILIRAALIIFAFAWISALFYYIPSRYSLLTHIGKNTLPIYLIHGLFVKLLKFFDARINDTASAIIIAFLLCLSLASLSRENLKKKVDSALKNRYNNKYNNIKEYFPWILKQKSKKS